MARALCQQALDRVITYLRNYGIAPDVAVCRQALNLIDEELAQGSEGLMARTMDRLPEVFNLQEPVIPPQSPPLKRGSIGYHHGPQR